MIDTLKDIVEYKTSVLCTVDNEGKPHSRFMELFEANDNKILMGSGEGKEVFNQLKNNGNVCLTVQGDGKFYRLEGTAEVVEKSDYMLETFEHIAKMYKDREDSLRTFEVNVVKIIEADFTKGAPQFNTYEA